MSDEADEPPPVDLTPPAHAGVVAVLEDALRRARRGEITGVAVVWVETDGCAASNYSRGRASLMALHWGAAYLVQRLLNHVG